ncbi:MAG TPA: cob(I)yrinic acid a,c-diamide adenosyltransferase [Opitutaceae bacterium]|nr:cob(I)yrinic acid a,c-diamide adenosyltransferase [Opitutaceae bacterium]
MSRAGKASPRSIATRKGDDGTTGLLYGWRVAKDHPQVEALGAFDEFNAAIGLAKATGKKAARRAELTRIQQNLIAVMGELSCSEADASKYAASKFPKLGEADLARVDQALAALEAKDINLGGWATPGANVHAAALDLARTAARRAERRLTTLPAQGRRVRPILRQWINRVSDLLWMMAREAEQ